MLTAWLIRHGESLANTGHATVDPTSIELSPQGYDQAQQIAQLFDLAPTLIVTSPYLRTQATAAPTMERFPRVPQAEWAVQEFTYLSPPRYRNTSIKDRRPAAQAYWKNSDPHAIDGEGAESFADFIGRVQQLKSRIAAEETGLVAIFTHETFMQALLWTILTGAPALDANQMLKFRIFSGSFSIPNGALVRLEFRGTDIWTSGIVPLEEAR